MLPLAISLHQTPASWAALGAVVGFLILLYIFGAKFSSLLLGADKRTSTSKFQALLWTLLLAWALLTLTFEGRTDFDLAPDYLALLGFPALALVFAKGLVQQKLEQGDIAKPPPASQSPPDLAVDPLTTTTGDGTSRSMFKYFGDIVNDDAGKADIVDFQYVVFNLVAATYFLINFINGNALPQIPEYLIALTGVSAGTYVANKALLKQKPTLTGVSPASAPPGTKIALRGINLAGEGSKPDGTAAVTEVKFDTTSQAPSDVSDGGVLVAVPANVEGYTSGTPKTVHISILNAAGLESNQVPFTIT